MSQADLPNMPSRPVVGPPYPPETAQVGGRPSINVDVPPMAVFMSLYIIFAAINMTIFQVNKRRGHRFIPSAALFGFCMSRLVTGSLRIAWAVHPDNVRVAIAAQVFVNAGILILYIINIVLAQRMLRMMKPRVGWHWLSRIVFKILYALIPAALLMVVAVLVVSVYTLNPHTRQITRDVQLAGITYLFTISTLPLFLIIFTLLPPHTRTIDPFGTGSVLSKMLILSWSSCLCVIIAGFKVGTLWDKPRPLSDPAWFDSKAAFYSFNFTLEILVLVVLTAFRIDRRFWVPNGSKAPGDYTRLSEALKFKKALDSMDIQQLEKKDPKWDPLDTPQLRMSLISIGSTGENTIRLIMNAGNNL